MRQCRPVDELERALHIDALFLGVDLRPQARPLDTWLRDVGESGVALLVLSPAVRPFAGRVERVQYVGVVENESAHAENDRDAALTVARNEPVKRARAWARRRLDPDSRPRTHNRLATTASSIAHPAEYSLSHRNGARNGPKPFMSEYVQPASPS